MNIMEKITHCCLTEEGFGPNLMSKTIMEELGLSCSNENTQNMLSFNKQKNTIVVEIKDVTLVMCSHLEIRTTCNIPFFLLLLANMEPTILFTDYNMYTSWPFPPLKPETR